MQPSENPTDVLSVIQNMLEAEQDAIETYRALICAAEEPNDPMTEDLAVTLLVDEAANRTEFRTFENEYQNE